MYKGNNFMKKAKFMLSIIAAFAIIGGAFALKANRSEVFLFTKASPSAPCLLVTKVNIDFDAPCTNNAFTTLLTTTTSLPVHCKYV
jgi:hypothetical protein